MLLRHSLTYALARGLPGLINFAAIAVYTRLLAPGEYGEYSLVLAGVALADSLLIQWLRLGILRFLPQSEAAPPLLLTVRNAWLAVALLLSLLVISAIMLPWVQLPPGLLIAGLLLFLAQGWFELNLELIRSSLHPGRYGRLALLRALLSLSLGALLAWQFQAVGLLSGLAAGTLLAYVLLREGKEWRAGGSTMTFDRILLRRLLSYGLPLTITLALSFIVNSSDRFLIGWFLDTDAAGLYSAGYDLAQYSITMLLTVVNLAAYPLTVRALEQEGPEAARERLHDTLLLLLCIGLPAAAGLTLLAGPVAQVVVAPEFTGTAAAVIPLITVAALLAGLKAYFVDIGFQLHGDTRQQAWVMLSAAGLNVLLNIVLIPRVGLMGAVWSTVAVYAVALLLSVMLVRRSFRLPALRPVLLRPVLATAGMVLLLIVLPQPAGITDLLLVIGAAALAYALLLGLQFPTLVRRLLRM